MKLFINFQKETWVKENEKDKGRKIPYYSSCVKELKKWTEEVDDKHIVKYTNSSPNELFEEEKHLLQNMIFDRWDYVKWEIRNVGEDWKIQIEKAFYSIPCKYIGEKVMVGISSSEIIVYFDHCEITRHNKSKIEWERVIKREHAPPNYEEYLSATNIGVKMWAKNIGESTLELVEKIFNQRGIDGLRCARGLCALSKKYGNTRVDSACKRALYYNLIRLKEIRNILEKEMDKLSLEQIDNETIQKELDFDESFKYARDERYYNCFI